MRKRVYISADYSLYDGDRDVVDELHSWANNNRYLVEFVDTAAVSSGSVSDDPDCRPCDLKEEFNRQINASSAVLFVVGNKTASRTAGSGCFKASPSSYTNWGCTPYKQNTNGSKPCKLYYSPSSVYDVDCVNRYSYLRHEFEQAKKRNKTIIIVYNSLYKQPSWLPPYMAGFEYEAVPFWIKNGWGNRVGDYAYIKEALGY